MAIRVNKDGSISVGILADEKEAKKEPIQVAEVKEESEGAEAPEAPKAEKKATKKK